MIKRPFRHQAKCFFSCIRSSIFTKDILLKLLKLFPRAPYIFSSSLYSVHLVRRLLWRPAWTSLILLCVSPLPPWDITVWHARKLSDPPLLTIPTSHKKAGALSAYVLFTWITKTHFFTHQDISLWCKEIFPPLPLTPFPPLSFTGWKTKASVSLVWHHLDSHLSCHHLEHHQYCWASYQICLTTKTKVACYHEILLFQNF